MKIYLAGGLRGDWRERVKIGAPKHGYFDPSTHGLTDEAAYTAWDLDHIDMSDMVLAYMNTDNPRGFGLNLEVGYARARGLAIWYVCEDETARQRYFGMVRACSTQQFSSLDAAIAMLKLTS